MSQTETKTSRKPRADAAKNRQKIIEVATLAFEKQGVNISMDAVAKQAGVGAGTLYRNFPNRDALLAAVLEESEEALPSLEAREGNSLEVLRAWLHELSLWFSTFEGMAEPLREAATSAESPLNMKCQDVIAVLNRLLADAQKDGYARENVTGQDLYFLTLGVAWAAQYSDHPQNLQQVLETGWRL